jgi:glycosyltransferase involved in cell wall biosynthesis
MAEKEIAILQTDVVRNNGAELVSMMQARELDADLWCSKYDEGVFPDIAEEIDIYEYGMALEKDRILSTTLNTILPAFKSSEFLEDYDVVIAHKDLSEIIASKAKDQHDVQFIWYMHNTSDFLYDYKQMPFPVRLLSKTVGAWLRKKDQMAFENSDKVFTNSEKTKKEVCEPVFGETSKVEALYPPVRQLEGSEKAKDYAIFLSRITRGKNIEEAIQEMEGREEKLKIAGKVSNEKYKRELEELAEDKGVDVEFLGFVPNDDLGRVLSEAKFGIFTQKGAHFGLVPLEMIKVGTPCFVRGNIGAAEILPEELQFPIESTENLDVELNLNKAHYDRLRSVIGLS